MFASDEATLRTCGDGSCQGRPVRLFRESVYNSEEPKVRLRSPYGNSEARSE